MLPVSLLFISYRKQLSELLPARARRKLKRGLKRKSLTLLKRLRRAKKEAGPLDKPEVVKTHLRNMLVLPEMVGSVIGIYNGKTFNQVEIKVCLVVMNQCYLPLSKMMIHFKHSQFPLEGLN